MKIGILGGTFDPVHLGHLAIAEEARLRLNLDEVIVLLAGQPWMKRDTAISPAVHRLNMLKLALEGKKHYKISTIEIERPGPSYSVEAIAELVRHLGTGVDIYFIIGWDSLAGLPKWQEPARLISMCTLVTVPRPGYSAPDIRAMEKVIPGLSRRLVMLDKPEIAISATEIRERVRRGLSISHLVPEAVERYIKEHKLYVTE